MRRRPDQDQAEPTSRFAWCERPSLWGIALVALISLQFRAVADDLGEGARTAVQQALYAAAATQSASERVLDARLNEQRKAIDSLQSQLSAANARGAEAQAIARDLQAQLTQAQERYVAQLAELDRTYAQEIAVFRDTVQDIASTPEGEAALRQYNAGEEVKALAVLDQLNDARRRARHVRADLEEAADRRRVATLALDARDKGKVDTNSVIARFEEVTRLDPGLHWDWVELGRLYAQAGRLPQARTAAERAAETAGTDRDLSISMTELGNVLVAQGDLVSANKVYQESLEVARRLAALDASSASLQRDLSLSLTKVGDVLLGQGDLAGASTRYEESLEILRRLAAADPSSASLQLDVSVSLIKVGDVLVGQGSLVGARRRYEESLGICRRLAASDASSASLQRDLSVSLTKVGDLLEDQGDLIGARRHYEQSLEIVRHLAATDSSSASNQRGVGGILDRLGDVLVGQDDLAGARRHYEQSLEIGRRLAAADASSAVLQRDVSASLTKLGAVLVGQGHLASGRRQYEESLGIRRRLAAADPSSAVLQRDVSVSESKLGDVLMEQRDLVGARTYFEGSLKILRRLAMADPSSAVLQRDVCVLLWRLAGLDAGVTWEQVVEAMEEMQRRGVLRPADIPSLEEARRRAGASAEP